MILNLAIETSAESTQAIMIEPVDQLRKCARLQNRSQLNCGKKVE